MDDALVFATHLASSERAIDMFSFADLEQWLSQMYFMLSFIMLELKFVNGYVVLCLEKFGVVHYVFDTIKFAKVFDYGI